MLEMMLAKYSVPVETSGNIKKAFAGNNSLIVMTNDGDIYARGVDTSANVAGIGNGGVSVVGSWVHTLTGVSDFWVGAAFVLYHMLDGRWMWHGSYLQDNAATVPSNLSSSMSALGSNTVKKIAVGSASFMLLDNAGNLYTMGQNTNGVLFTGNTTAQRVLTLRTETNIKDIAMCTGVSTCYIHYNDNSVKGAGFSTNGQLGIASTTVNTLRVVASTAANQIVSQVVAGYDMVWFNNIGSGNWTYLGSYTNGQCGNNVSTGSTTVATANTTIPMGSKLYAGSYSTWAYNSTDKTWRFTGNVPKRSGTNTISGVWNISAMVNFNVIPMSPYIIPDTDIIIPSGAGQNNAYYVYNGWLYGCGDGGSFKLLPGFAASTNVLGMRKLDVDFTHVE